jgi:hypothetical protein
MLREWKRFWASKKKTQRQAAKICAARLSLLAKGAYEFWASRCEAEAREQEEDERAREREAADMEMQQEKLLFALSMSELMLKIETLTTKCEKEDAAKMTLTYEKEHLNVKVLSLTDNVQALTLDSEGLRSELECQHSSQRHFWEQKQQYDGLSEALLSNLGCGVDQMQGHFEHLNAVLGRTMNEQSSTKEDLVTRLQELANSQHEMEQLSDDLKKLLQVIRKLQAQVSMRMQRHRCRKIISSWQWRCAISKRFRGLDLRVRYGAVCRLWARWCLRMYAIEVVQERVQQQLSEWWEDVSWHLMPFTYDKSVRNTVFLIWKQMEGHWPIMVVARSAWHRLERLVVCKELHARFESTLSNWRVESQKRLAKLLNAANYWNSHIKACLRNTIQGWQNLGWHRRSVLHWRNKLLQTCFRRFHMAHKASKSMENIEFLAVGQLLWRKARCYLRHLAFTTWHLSTVSYTRALKKAHRTVLISR